MAELFTRYERYLLRIAERYVGPSDCAEDLVMEAFIRMIPHLNQVDFEKSHKARNYLVAVVEHLAIDELRKKKCLPFQEELLSDFFTETFDEYLEKKQDQRYFSQALRQLRPKDEQILRLKYIEEMSDEEISQLLLIGESAVRKRLERARRRFREVLEVDSIERTEK